MPRTKTPKTTSRPRKDTTPKTTRSAKAGKVTPAREDEPVDHANPAPKSGQTAPLPGLQRTILDTPEAIGRVMAMVQDTGYGPWRIPLIQAAMEGRIALHSVERWGVFTAALEGTLRADHPSLTLICDNDPEGSVGPSAWEILPRGVWIVVVAGAMSPERFGAILEATEVVWRHALVIETTEQHAIAWAQAGWKGNALVMVIGPPPGTADAFDVQEGRVTVH
jgi:hypothetical protein